MIKSRLNRLAPMGSMAALAAVLATASAPAFANMENLLEKLHSKGLLSDDEYKELRQEAREATRANRDFKADIMGDKAKRELPTGLNGAFSNNFTWTSGDGANSIRLTGRVHADYRFQDSYGLGQNSNLAASSSVADDFELRRTRLGVQGTLFRDIDYNAVLNMVGSSTNVVDTAFMNFKYLPLMNFQFGRFKQPFSLGQLTSSNDIDFAERSYVDTVIPGKKLGAMVHGEPRPGLTYAASVYQEGFDELTEQDGRGKRFAGRLTGDFAQFAKIDNTVLHFAVAGVGGEYQLVPTGTTQNLVSFQTMNRGMSGIFTGVVGGTTANTAVNVDQSLYGLETALARGPLKLQGEWVRARYDANSAINNASGLRGDLDTWYLQAVWNVTGEKWSEMYRSGVFRGVTPNNNFRPGSGWGAWQVGLRWSQFDASDLTGYGTNSGVTSGGLCSAVTSSCARRNDKVDSYGIGVNWILNPMSRVMFEWTRTDFGGLTTPTGSVGGVSKENVFSIRTQVMF